LQFRDTLVTLRHAFVTVEPGLGATERLPGGEATLEPAEAGRVDYPPCRAGGAG
jgi:hypothetical protein